MKPTNPNGYLKAEDYQWSILDVGNNLMKFNGPDEVKAYMAQCWPGYHKGKVSGYFIEGSKQFRVAWRAIFDGNGKEAGTLQWEVKKTV